MTQKLIRLSISFDTFVLKIRTPSLPRQPVSFDGRVICSLIQNLDSHSIQLLWQSWYYTQIPMWLWGIWWCRFYLFCSDSSSAVGRINCFLYVVNEILKLWDYSENGADVRPSPLESLTPLDASPFALGNGLHYSIPVPPARPPTSTA